MALLYPHDVSVVPSRGYMWITGNAWRCRNAEAGTGGPPFFAEEERGGHVMQIWGEA